MTETCLAMTIFRSEFDGKFAGLFGLLLAMKSFHWVVQGVDTPASRHPWPDDKLTTTHAHTQTASSLWSRRPTLAGASTCACCLR